MRRIRIVMVLLGVLSIGFGAFYIYNDRVNADTKGPEISFDKEVLTLAIGADEEEMLQGVQAVDDQDGDVSKSLVVEDIKKKDGEFNEFEVGYIAFDRSSNSKSKTRKLQYEGYHKPRFSISQKLSFSRTEQINLLDYINVQDSFDGDLSSYIVIEGNEAFGDNPKAGVYDCTLKVTNSIGDTSTLPIQVEVYEETAPEHALAPELRLTQQIVYLEKGAAFDPAQYLDSVSYNGIVPIDKVPSADGVVTGGISSSLISQNSDVDTQTEGNYTVTYEYTTLDGAHTLSAVLLVVVE